MVYTNKQVAQQRFSQCCKKFGWTFGKSGSAVASGSTALAPRGEKRQARSSGDDSEHKTKDGRGGHHKKVKKVGVDSHDLGQGRDKARVNSSDDGDLMDAKDEGIILEGDAKSTMKRGKGILGRDKKAGVESHGISKAKGKARATSSDGGSENDEVLIGDKIWGETSTGAKTVLKDGRGRPRKIGKITSMAKKNKNVKGKVAGRDEETMAKAKLEAENNVDVEPKEDAAGGENSAGEGGEGWVEEADV